MNNLTRLGACLVMACVGVNAFADYGDSNNLQFFNNVHIQADTVLTDVGIDIERSIILTNNGQLAGDIYVPDGRELFIQNSGTFSGQIHLAPRARLTQMVTGPAELTNINCGSQCRLLVRGGYANKIRMSDILAVGANAESIVLQDVWVILDVPTDNHFIELVGEVMFEQPAVSNDTDDTDPGDSANQNNSVLGPGLAGNGSVIVATPDDDSPKTPVVGRDDDGNLVLGSVTTPTLDRFLNPGTTKLIKTLRQTNPTDKLLNQLATVKSADDINRILDKSMRVHPINLMNIARTVDMFEMQDYATDSRVGVNAISIYSADLGLYGARGTAGVTWGPARLGLAGYYGIFNYEDDVNEFDGTIYGGNLRFGLDFRHLWLDTLAGMSVSRYEVGPVLDGDNLADNPRGRTLYGRADIGTRFALGESVQVLPFVGGGMHRSEILDETQNQTFGRLGLRTNIAFDVDGVRYNFGLHGTYDTDNSLDGRVDFGVHLMYDSIHIGVMVGVHHDDFATSVQTGLSGAITF